MLAKPEYPAIADKVCTSDSSMTPPKKKLLFFILVAGYLGLLYFNL